jgi:pre-mRNA cleavage complex 2 protein Pcf11
MSLPAAEVAADFRDALQDLRMNSRPEISNLTLIAKENTEYAQAISTELEQHIKSVSYTFVAHGFSSPLNSGFPSCCAIRSM